MENQDSRFWGIILAGGEGKRLQRFTKTLYREPRPKQFCTFTGTRSLFRHTLDRTRMIISSERLLTVINRHHRPYADDQLGDVRPENVVELPCSRETAPSILLSLLKIERHAPEAIVGIFPSDHFVLEERRFMDHIRTSFEFLRDHPMFLVLHGVEASHPETEYGWIETAEQIRWDGQASFYFVKRFLEKPDLSTAKALLARNCLWNTLVLVGHVQTLIGHFRSLLPELYLPLERIRPTLDTRTEREKIEATFHDLPSVDFSGGFLMRIPSLLCVARIDGVGWNDWGDQRRIQEDITRLNARPIDKRPKHIERVEAMHAI